MSVAPGDAAARGGRPEMTAAASDAPLTFRCELTAERLDRAAPELALALAAWARRAQEAQRPARERIEPPLRALGVGLSALGVLLSGWAVATSPAASCPRAGASEISFQVATPLFALLGVVFWFLPRVTAALRAWVPGAAARRAPRVLSALRPHLPAEVGYRIAEGRIESSLSRPRRHRVTPLAEVGGVVVGDGIACVFGRPPLARLLRVVWLPGAREREAFLAALARAGIAASEAGPLREG